MRLKYYSFVLCDLFCDSRSPCGLFPSGKLIHHSIIILTEQLESLFLVFAAEFLNTYVLDHKPLLLQPRGLTNRSNYCYINAILQALVACPTFYNLMKAIPPSQENKGTKSRTPIVDSM